MKNPAFEKIVETAQRRPLNSSEQAELDHCLRQSPELREEWALEQKLNLSLRSLPDAQLTPGFTERVLKAVENENLATQEPTTTWARLIQLAGRWLLPATAALTLLIGGVLTARFNANQQLAATGSKAAEFASLGYLVPSTAPSSLASANSDTPPFQWLKDYDTISLLPSQDEITADVELLASLQ